MALISCPECGKQISDTAPSCPHCGYLFSTSTSAYVKQPKPTKIGEFKQNVGGGIAILAVGIIGLFCSLVGLIIFLPLGILAIIGSVMILLSGYITIKGTSDVVCPYCSKPQKLMKGEETLKCSHCKKRSVRNGDYLNPVL